MIRQLSVTLLATLTLSLSIASTSAAAETADESAPPPTRAGDTRKPVSAAFLFGHGSKEAFKTGFGGRIGYTLASKLYVGGSFLWHVGTPDGPAQANVWYGGGEVGYELDAGPVILRPYAGAGIASIHASVFMPRVGGFEGGRIEATESRFAVWPGASLLIPIDRAFIGVDAKYVVVHNANALNTYATLGVAF